MSFTLNTQRQLDTNPYKADNFNSSGLPHQTGSTALASGGTEKIEFSHLTIGWTIKNLDSSNDLYWSYDKDLTRYSTIGAGESFTETTKCKDLFLSGTVSRYEVMASLSNVPRHKVDIAPITGTSGNFQGYRIKEY